MNKFISAIICVSTILFGFNASAELALSKKVIQQLNDTQSSLELITNKDENFFQQITVAMMQGGKDEMLTVIKSSAMYPEIKSIVGKSVFGDVEQLLDVASRVSAATLLIEKENQPEDPFSKMSIEELSTQIDLMKKMGLPPEAMAMMDLHLSNKKNGIDTFENMTKHASEADVKFVKDNLAWVNKVMDNDVMPN